MKYKILDIWAIQQFPNEIYTALNNITTDDSIIFENVKSVLYIGGKKLNTYFNTVVYSEKSDVMLLLMKGGKATVEQIKTYFDERNMNYNSVVFVEHKNPKIKYDIDNNRELWFARDSYVVNDALDDSKGKGNSTCAYNPEEQSLLKLKYPTSSCTDNMLLDKILFKGTITLDDKIVLIVDDIGSHIDQAVIENILEEKGFIDKNTKNTGI